MSIQKIINQLKDHEQRIRLLESTNKDVANNINTKTGIPKKALTLPEIIKGKNFKSGQEKVAIIIGYYEKVSKVESIKESHVKKGWNIGKFNGKYNPNLLARAIKEGLARNINGNLDLSQTGEEFWDLFLE